MSKPIKTISLNEQKISNPNITKEFELNKLCMIDF